MVRWEKSSCICTGGFLAWWLEGLHFPLEAASALTWPKTNKHRPLVGSIQIVGRRQQLPQSLVHLNRIFGKYIILFIFIYYYNNNNVIFWKPKIFN